MLVPKSTWADYRRDDAANGHRTPVVEIRGAKRVYKRGDSEVLALAGIDFVIDESEYVSVIGASGSGKSTLLNIVGTLDKLDEGTFRLDGRDVSGMNDLELSALRCSKIGFVFQAFHLLPLYTALENVELPLVYAGVPKKERRERAAEALARVGLAERATHLPSELSGGQQQRVSVARALVNRPSLVLADEPTGALDSTTTGEILDLFESLNASGVTILMVTHDHDVAERTHRIVRMRDGHVAEDRSRLHQRQLSGVEPRETHDDGDDEAAA